MHPFCSRSLQGGPLRFGWVLQQPAVPKVVSKRTVVACTATRTSSSSTTDSGSSGSNTDINRIAGDWGELASSLSQQPSSVRRTRRIAVPPPQEVGPKCTVSSPARQRRIRSSDTDIDLPVDGPARGPPRQHATPARTSFPASNMQQPQHQLQRNGAKAQASITARNKSSKSVKKVAALSASKHPCCYGCGAPLQIEVPLGPGYVPADKYEMKKKHKQLNKVLCARCCELCNGAMIPAVQDFTQKAWAQQQAALLQQQQQAAATHSTSSVKPADSKVSSPAVKGAQQQLGAGGEARSTEQQSELLGKMLVTPEELREKIMPVRGVKAVAVLLVDLLDASGTLMSKVRDLVGNNPIILVGTKMDLLPAGCHPKAVAEWLAESAIRKRLQVASCHLVSSHTGEGIAAVTAKICRERKGRDVFVVGAANVGKSAFIRAMLKEMSSLSGGNFSGAALATSRYVPVESSMPGTTLGLIPLQAFDGGGTLYDTPGVHLHHRIPHMLTPEELKLLHPRRRLKPFSPPTPLDVTTQQQQQQEQKGTESTTGFTATAVAMDGKHAYEVDHRSIDGSNSSSKPKQVSATYAWGGLVRVDVVSAPPETSVVFYGPSSLMVYDQSLAGEHEALQLESDSKQQGLLGVQSVEARGGLIMHELAVPTGQGLTSSCVADLAISGLPGWVAIHAPVNDQRILLRVWAPKGVEVFLRPPLPCPAPYMDAEELGALEGLPAGEDWAAYREGLGLKEMSAADEDVVKMLLFGADA